MLMAGHLQHLWIVRSRKNTVVKKQWEFSVVLIEELVKLQCHKDSKTMCSGQIIQNYIFDLKLIEVLKTKVVLIKPI